mmetsp:Transcript_96590/g.273065  ORF Transcript_96590/g.273065 Transcript_96590/m.273065 type:complete len:163 (+) Transcript_96590:93-581(+)
MGGQPCKEGCKPGFMFCLQDCREGRGKQVAPLGKKRVDSAHVEEVSALDAAREPEDFLPSMARTVRPEAGQPDDAGAFEVKLVRHGTIGLLVTPETYSGYLEIDGTLPSSLIAEWNNTQPESKRIRPGHQIIRVNGCSGSGYALLTELQNIKQGEEIHMVIK